MTINVIYSPADCDVEPEPIVEWRFKVFDGRPTLEARNPGGEFTPVLCIDDGVLDHTYTPKVDGVEVTDEGHIKLAYDG